MSDKNQKQPFVISKVSRNGFINHQRVDVLENGHYRLEIKIAADKTKIAESTDNDLIEFIKTLKDDLYLRNSATGSSFIAVFEVAQTEGYVV